MEKSYPIGLDYEYWAKKILYFYGLLSIVAIGGQLVGLIVTFYYYYYYVEEYISLRMMWPTSLILAIMLISWIMVKGMKIYNPYILFFRGFPPGGGHDTCKSGFAGLADDLAFADGDFADLSQ
ncbi:hypothetical protein [Metaplanococcus flavidus]|uniref:Uncharacterized protein n=1 Tax=Metaplanococcus flavidus TaxID=569883 RepID=A0ABW3LCB8_9BACL